MITPDEQRDLDVEFYETPCPFTQWLAVELSSLGIHDLGTLCEPCVGTGAIVDALQEMAPIVKVSNLVTGDIDTRRVADVYGDATKRETWHQLREAAGPDGIDWTVSNTPFATALEIAEQARRYSTYGVALHVRCTLNEPLKTPGLGRSYLRANPPNLTLWLPRFAYRRSRTTGKWATDSAPCVWLAWVHALGNYRDVRYAPDWVIDATQAIQTERARVDRRRATETASAAPVVLSTADY